MAVCCCSNEELTSKTSVLRRFLLRLSCLFLLNACREQKKPKFISKIVLYYLLRLYLLFMILEFQLRGGGGGELLPHTAYTGCANGQQRMDFYLSVLNRVYNFV